MDKDFNANNSWDDGLSTSRLSDNNNTGFSSWEDKKVQQSNKELDIIGDKLRNVEYFNKRADAAIVSVGEKVEKIKNIADDIDKAIPTYNQLSDKIDYLANVVKRTFSYMTLTVAQSSYDEAKENLSSIMDEVMIKAISDGERRAKGIVDEGVAEMLEERKREAAALKKQMEEDIAQYDLQIKSRKEELKDIEKKSNGKFITDKQLAFLIAGYAFLLAAAVWGLSATVKQQGAPGWVMVLLFVGLTANLIFYALKFAWKGLKWLWNRIPGNND